MDANQLIDQAISAARAGRREVARRHLLEALKADPQNARAARLLAKLNAPDTDAKASPATEQAGSPHRLALFALMALLLLAPLVIITLMLTTASGDDGLLPTEFVLAAPSLNAPEPQSQALSQAVSGSELPTEPSVTQTNTPTDEAVIVQVTEESTIPPLPTNTPPQFNVVFATFEPAQIVLPTTPPLPRLTTSEIQPFSLLVTPLPTNTPITFNLPTAAPLPSSTPITFNVATPAPAATATPTDEPIVPLPTSTLMPEFVFGTDVPTPDMRTPIPPTLETFSVDPAGGGGGPPSSP